MTESRNVEYCLLRYVPNVLSDRSVSIAAIVINSSNLENGICTMICAADWEAKVRILDPDADVGMLEALLTEIRDRLLSASQRSDMILQLEDSFSNAVQVSQRRKCPVALRPEAVEAFARRLLQKTSKISPTSSGMRAVPCEATL
jgi:hypothetical protein